MRILFLPFAAPKGAWNGDLAALVARQLPRQAVVLLARAPGLEARFAILGGEGGRAPAVLPRLGPPAEVVRAVGRSWAGDLVADGRIHAGSCEVRVLSLPGGEIFWERSLHWSLPTLQRAIRGLAGALLERLGRTRGDLVPALCRSQVSYFRFLRAEDLALQARYGSVKNLATRALAAYKLALLGDPAFTPALAGLVRLIPVCPREEALSALLALVRLPIPPDGAAWLGRGLDLLGRTEEALDWYGRCHRADPTHPWASRAVGDRLLKEGQVEAARQAWRACLEAGRADPSLLGRLGSLLGRLGRWDEAEEVLSRLPGQAGVTSDLWRLYAEVLERRHGPGPAARALASRLQAEAPAEALLDLGLLHLKAGQEHEAGEIGRRLAEGQDAEARRMGALLLAAARRPGVWEEVRQGAICLEGGRPGEARRRLLQAARAWPHLAEVRYLLGVACLRLGRHREGAAALQACLALDPAYTEGRSKLGIALVALGRFAEAYDHLVQALAESPDHVGILVHLAQACYYLGRCREGELYARRARILAPENPQVIRLARDFFRL